MTKIAPLCRYCGTPIRKSTRTVYLVPPGSSRRAVSDWIRHVEVEPGAMPKSKAECQRFTNDEVVSVSWSKDYETGQRQHISMFTTWDRESYVSEFFCNGDHAKRFAFVMARTGAQTKAHEHAEFERRRKL